MNGDSDRPNRNLTIRIYADAVRHNLQRAQAAAAGSRVFAVVKSDAYGHGVANILPALSGADGLAVVTVAEGLHVRRLVPDTCVLVLQGFRTPDELIQCHRNRLLPVLHCHQQLDMLAGQPQAALPCWIKLDTGMGRLGFFPDDIASVMECCARTGVQPIGLLSHFACADEPESSCNDRQSDSLQSTAATIAAQSIRQPELSIANSAALLANPATHLDWIRPGLMLYGASPFAGQSAASLGLRAVMEISAPVIAIRQLAAGSTVGYEGTWRCFEDTVVAVVAAGYGDGYPRNVTADAAVSLAGQRCQILGRVSMDSLVVDISACQDVVSTGQSAVLWGDEQVAIDEVARWAGTIPYELMCSVRGNRLLC